MRLLYDGVFDPEWVKYGIEGAIFLAAMVVLFLLYGIIKKGNDSFQEKMASRQNDQERMLSERQREQDERAKQQDEKFSKAIDALLKGQSHIHTQEEENITSKFTNFVHIELDKLVKTIKCSRAYFVIYHNGAWSNNGISLPKMSLINESFAGYDMESIMPQLQSIPRGFLPGLDAIFEKEGKIYYRDIEKFKEKDPITYSWLTLHGTKSAAIFPVKDICKDYNIGFVVAEYYGEIPESVTDKMIKIHTSKVAEGIAAAACFTNEDEKLAAGHGKGQA